MRRGEEGAPRGGAQFEGEGCGGERIFLIFFFTLTDRCNCRLIEVI